MRLQEIISKSSPVTGLQNEWANQNHEMSSMCQPFTISTESIAPRRCANLRLLVHYGMNDLKTRDRQANIITENRAF